MNITLVEIIDRSTQGVTRPFLCRGDDGCLYYVKGRHAGHQALISEWIAGHLGQRLGLPIPEFGLATAPRELVSLSARSDIGELGAGVGFASRFVSNADELTFLYINQLDPALRAKILLFDWWVANGDRTLTAHGGNPNLLWVHRDHQPFVIDHNMAFDQGALPDFWSQHIFAESRSAWTKDFRSSILQLMEAAVQELEALWQAMPPEWTEVQGEVTLESATRLLWRFKTDPVKFWEAA